MRHAAFLRGINVGKAKRVAMADLRKVVESLGYTDVSTLLNSGNIVFTVPAKSKGDPATRIEEAVAKKLGVQSRVTVLTAAEVAKVVAGNPMLEIAADPTRLLIAFLAKETDAKSLEPMSKQDWSPGAFALGKRAAYLWCPAGLLESKLAIEFGKKTKDGATTRNWATVLRIHEALK